MTENDSPSQSTWDIEPPQPETKNGHGEMSDELVYLETGTSVAEEKDTVTFRRSHLYAMLIPLTFVLGLSVGYLFWGRTGELPIATALSESESEVAAPATTSEQASASETTNQTDTQSQTTDQTQNQQIVRYDVPIDNEPFYGPENAPITLIEFSDYECPYCRKWHAEVFQRLLDTYAGQIKFVYRDFPLTSIHPNAFSAAEAANCAGDQGVYWAYHEMLFSMELGLGNQAYKQYASELGINMDTFNACLADGKYKDEIQADFEYAAQLGVRSTPTFFINGIALVGAQPYETFQQVIEKELAGEIP